MNKEKIIKIIVTIIIIIIIIVGLLSIGNVKIEDGKIKTTKNSKNNGVKATTNEGILKDKKIKKLDITDVSMSYVEGNGTTFKLTLSNNTEDPIELKSLNILFKDKDGNTIDILSATTGGVIKSNQKNIIRLTHPDDLTKAASIEYEEGN